MPKKINEYFTESITNQMPEVYIGAVKEMLQLPDVRSLSLTKFMEQAMADPKLKDVVSIFTVESFAATVGTRKKKEEMPDYLGEKILAFLESKQGDWISGSEIAQTLDGVQGASPQAVAARLRVLVKQGTIRSNDQKGASRRYASIQSEKTSQKEA